MVTMLVFSVTVWLVLSTRISARISTAYKNYLDCSFESDCPLLIQDDQDDFDWQRGRLRVRGEGDFAPSADATFGNQSGWYLYTPSPGTTGSLARLASVSLPVPINTTVHVDFAYHMYDEQSTDRLGSLKVYVCTELLWSRSGNQGPSWVRKQLNTTCPETSLQVVFEGKLGGHHSDIGIDDVSIGFDQEVQEGTSTEPYLHINNVTSKTALVGPTCTIIESKVWTMVAVVSIAVVGCLVLCLILSVVHICKLRKRSSEVLTSLSSSGKTSKQTPSKLSDSYTAYKNKDLKDLKDREYCDLNAVGGASKPQSSVRYSSMYLQPKATSPKEKQNQYMRTHKLSWSNDAEDVDVYEAIDC